MKKAYYYFLVEPFRDEYIDKDSIQPKTTIFIEKEPKTYEVAIFAEKNMIYMIRITVPDLEEAKISEEEAKIVQSLKEHMKSTLRFMYDKDVNFFTKHFFTFHDENIPYSIGFKFKMFLHTPPRDYDKIQSVYGLTLPIRNQMRLLSDSQDPNIPYQCKLLSLYKLLELEFKEKGKWNYDEFDSFLKIFEDDFNKLNLSNRELRNYIHEIRDKCAHIKSNKDILYYIELDGKNVKEVEIFLNFLINMCASLLDKKYGDENLTFGTNLLKK